VAWRFVQYPVLPERLGKVARVHRKLGIRSRAELGSRFTGIGASRTNMGKHPIPFRLRRGSVASAGGRVPAGDTAARE